MNFHSLRVLALIGVCCAPVLQAAEPLRLEDAVARVLGSNPSIVAETAQLQAVRARAEREGLAPSFVIGGDFENGLGTGSLQGVDSAETTLRIGRVIELGGKREARQNLGRAEVSLQQHLADTARIDLVSRTSLRFIEVLARQKRLEYAEERVKQAELTRREVSARVASASNPESDLQAARIALAEAELVRETAEHELTSARVTLAASWGDLMPDFGPVVGDLQSLPSVEPFEVLAARLSKTPELWTSQLQAETINARLRVAEANAKPNIDLNFGVRRMEAFNDHGVVMSFSVPLGSRKRSVYEVTQANAELASLEARRDAERFERHQALFEIYQELVHARHEAEALHKRMLPMAEEALETTRRGFESGGFSFISLAQAQRTLFELNERAVEASARYHLLLVEVERLTIPVEDMTR